MNRPRPIAWAIGALVVAVVGLVGPLAGSAQAHARLVGSSPEADEMLDQLPEEVELYFDEAVNAIDGGIEIIGPDGDGVQDGTVETAEGGTLVRAGIAPDAAEARGTFTVSWRVTSEDSHVIDGAYLFHVGERTGAADLSDPDDRVVDAAGWVGRWLGLAGSVVGVGAALLAAVTTEARVRARLRLVVVPAAVVATVGVAVALVSRVAELHGSGLLDAVGDVPSAIGDYRSAEYLAWRLLLLALLVAAATVGWVWRRSPLVAVVLGGGSLVMASIAGHAWTSGQRALSVTADVAHFGAVSVWIGGLVALLVALPVATEAGRLAGRFSALALGAVAVVVVTGTTLGCQHLGGPGELTSTTYGRLLSVKVLLFLALVGLGWLNRSRLIGLVERSLVPLTRSLRVEIGVAAVVLGLTAALVNTPPSDTGDAGGGEAREGEEVDGEPFSAVAAADQAEDDAAVRDLGPELALDVVPARVGANQLHLNFRDHDGQPLEVLIAQAEVARGDTAPLSVDLDLLTPTHAFADGVELPNPGTWTVQVTALPVALDETVVFTFEVPIP